MWRQAFRSLALLAGVLFWTWSSGAAAAEIVTLAKTGDPAPGTGVTFGVFNNFPSVNGAGEVAFEGNGGSGGSVTQGLWIGTPNGLVLAASTDMAAPGTSGTLFDGFSSSPNVNGSGAVALQATLAGGGEGIWVGRPGNLALVARDGQMAPGAGGAVFDTFSTFPSLNAAGDVAFQATLAGGAKGIWVGGPGNLELVALEGGPAPDAGGAVFDMIGFPSLNGTAQVIFNSTLAGGVTPVNDRGIWFGGPGNLVLVARKGALAPGAGGAVFGDLHFLPLLNDAGHVTFRGDLAGSGVSASNDRGIWAGTPDNLALAAREGQTAPGAGGAVFDILGAALLNGAGELTFFGGLRGSGVNTGNDQGIWVGRPGDLVVAARKGAPAPGAPGTVFSSFGAPSLNGAGEIFLRGELTGTGVTMGNDRGLWAGPPGNLQLIIREGGSIEVAPGDQRIVADGSFSIGNSGNEDGRRSPFSEGGQITFKAVFTDSSKGIFLAPPEAPPYDLLSHRAVGDPWQSFYLPRDYAKPVVIAGPPGTANKQPGVIRLDEVSGGGFKARFQEWRYLNGAHPEEDLSFLIMEKGRRKLANGSIWEAGILKIKDNANWKRKKFSKRFRGKPALFLTVQSSKDKAPVAVRARNVTRRSFEAALFEEEKTLGSGHKRERVGYLAVYSKKRKGTVEGGVDGTDYKLKQRNLDHKFKKVLGTKLRLEEERSQDKERKHKKETVSVMTLGRGLFAQQASDKEDDTTAIRRR